MTSKARPDAGILRHNAESLIRTQVTSASALAELKGAITSRVGRIGGISRSIGPTKLADDLERVAAQMGSAVDSNTADVSTVLMREAHSLLDKLAAEHHGVGPLPALDVRAIRSSDIIKAFPEGFARDYVRAVANEAARSRTVTKEEAVSQPGIQPEVIVSSRRSVVAKVSRKNQEQVEAWLGQPDCHAIKTHGPHITSKELELRLAWRRPPNHGLPEADRWRGQDDGRVASRHKAAGAEVNAFRRPEGLAKPLDFFLDVANAHAGGLHGFLDEHAFGNKAAFFVSADAAGIEPADVHGFRGMGIDTVGGTKDWVAMRANAMKAADECGPPVRFVPHNVIAEGRDPGVRLTFFKEDGQWFMITCYPADRPGPDNVQLRSPS